MIDIGLPDEKIAMIQGVISSTKATKAVIFGSRARGNFRENSDIDIALFGDITALEAEETAAKLELLPLPFMFDVQSFEDIKNPALREHIVRVGVIIWRRENYE